jgi:hypothetical protein
MSDVTEDSLVVPGGTKRRVGSVCGGEEGATLSVWLPARVIDEVIMLAKLNRMSTSRYTGRLIKRAVGRAIDLD